jgi:Ca2+-binding RTX toxin-like protein
LRGRIFSLDFPGDDYFSGGAGADSLVGFAGNGTLDGGAGNDLLDGGTGADRLIGGVGDDIYVVDNALDVVVEGAGAGTDLVKSSIGYALAANVENLTLTGTAAINGTGNALNNVIIGNAGANSLAGGAGNDTLDGWAGNDLFDGGTGADRLIGGVGDDTYVVDNVLDVVTEAAGACTDLVYPSINYTLAANVENLTLLGTAAINGTGNALNNAILGNDGTNSLSGGDGADSLAGGAGNDWFDGWAGAALTIGGDGLDTFVIKQGFGRDTIADFGATAANQDLLQVSTSVFANMQAFMAGASQVGSDVIVTATPNDVLTLKNVTLASLDATDLRFVA